MLPMMTIYEHLRAQQAAFYSEAERAGQHRRRVRRMLTAVMEVECVIALYLHARLDLVDTSLGDPVSPGSPWHVEHTLEGIH